jgi:transcriptional regulator with XRE-family HTH domain
MLLHNYEEDDAMNNIGQKIKMIRELRNYTRNYVASELKISLNTYGKIERDEANLTIQRLSRIAKILNVGVTTIIDFDQNKLLKGKRLN